jgi:FdhE protein
LQVHWTHLLLSTRERHAAQGEPFARGDDPASCPCCGTRPVASITRSSGESLGQRYLHCGLCNLEWHLPRNRCTNCGATQGISFQSLDLIASAEADSSQRAARAAVQAECCSACGHYLKQVHTDRDPFVDPVADDLASLTLDLLLAEQGQQRAGLNYLLLVGDPPAGGAPPDPGGD